MKRARSNSGPARLALTCAAALALAGLAVAVACIEDRTTRCDTGLRCPPGFACTADGSACTDSLCGNGIRDEGELCDDGNLRAGDGCIDCMSDGRCGNGIVDLGEECDPGVADGRPCDSRCRYSCGNQQIDPGEECDRSLFRVTCVDIGFDRGTASCDAITCVAQPTECGHIGWHRDVRMAEDVAAGTVGDLHGVWGADNGQIFAVGTDASATVVMVLRFNGQAWAIEVSGPVQGRLLDVWGSGFDDVFAVGEGGRVLHRSASGVWSSLNTGLGAGIALRGIWGDGAAGDIIAVGDGATIVRFVRSTGAWLPEPVRDIPPDTAFEAVWGHDADEMYAVGSGGVIMRYAASDWVREAEGLTAADLLDVWGTPDGEVFAVGTGGTILRRYQDEWSIMDSPQQVDLHALWGEGEDSVIATGERGVTLFYDGQTWNTLAVDTDSTLSDLWSVPGYGLVAVAPGGFLQRLEGWSFMPPPAQPAGDSLRDLWAHEFDEVHGVWGSHPYLRRFDGNAWSAVDIDALVPPASGGAGPLRGIWGTPEGALYVVGDDNLVLHFHPATGWERMTIPADIPASNLLQAWSSSDGHLFVVGELPGQSDGIILRHDGGSWSRMSKNRKTVLRGIWGVNRSEVFAVGSGGAILRYDGNAEGQFESMNSGTQESLNAIWGITRNHVHVVGDNGVALAFNGSVWSLSTNITTEHLYDVWGSGADHVFAVGSRGSLLHRTRRKWGAVRAGTDQWLTSIAGVNGESGEYRVVLFGGENGAFRRLLVNDAVQGGF